MPSHTFKAAQEAIIDLAIDFMKISAARNSEMTELRAVQVLTMVRFAAS
jgi:hypothetical protein